MPRTAIIFALCMKINWKFASNRFFGANQRAKSIRTGFSPLSLSLFAPHSLSNICVICICMPFQVYKEAFHYQFREPDTGDTHKEENAAEGGAGDGTDTRKTAGEEPTESKETEPGLLELSKPSEFRLKALKQQKYLTFFQQRHCHCPQPTPPVGVSPASSRGRRSRV